MDEQVFTILNAVQNPDQAVRHQGEAQLKEAMGHPEGGLSLSRLALNDQVPLPARQLAALLLKQYVTQYWSASFPQFIGPQMTPREVKEQIKPLLIHGLADPERKIRTAIAFALSSVAHSDWPMDFPELLPSLFGILNPGNINKDQHAIHGAMRVLAEFVRSDLMEEQLLDLLKESMPVLLGVIRATETAFSTRTQCVKIFRTSSKTLYMMKDEYPEVVKVAMEGVMPVWIEALGEVLSGKDAKEALETDAGWESINMRTEIFRTLTVLQNSFPRSLQPLLSSFIRISIAHLSSLSPVFHEYYLSTTSDLEPPADPDSDEGQNAGVTDLIGAIFDFLTGASRARAARATFVTRNDNLGASGSGAAMGRESPSEGLKCLIDEILGWTRITKEDAETWSDDPNAFVADEDDESESYSLRVAGFDLLGSLLDKYESSVAKSLQAASRRKMEEAEGARTMGDPDWWKSLEAALACIGSVADGLLDMSDEESSEGVAKSFDLEYLFKEVVPKLLNMTDTPFLQGRAFVFASQFVLVLAEAGISSQYLEAAVQALQAPGVDGVVKISAIRTLRNFCRYIKVEELQAYSLRIISDLVPYLAQATEETLALVLETIRAVIGVDASVLNGQNTPQLVEVVFKVWAENVSDPFLTSIIEEVFETVAASPSEEVYHSLVQSACPRLASAIGAEPNPDNMAATSSAMELLSSIMRGRKTDYDNHIGEITWPAIFSCMLATDDNDAIQHGCGVLTTFVRKSGPQLFSWKSAAGQNGLDLILALLSRLIDPSFSESGGLYMGDLIIHLLRNAGQHLAHVIPDLLGALARRIAVAKTTSYTQTLLLPFAYLLTVERDLTLDLLEGMQVPAALESPDQAIRTGLEVVIKAWCDDAIDTVNGSYSIRVNDMAMSNLLVSDRASLKAVVVKGDLIVDETNRNTIMTRSRTKQNPNKFTSIPFHLRALKYLLGQISNAEVAEQENAKMAGNGIGGMDRVEGDDGDEEWEEEDDLTKGEKEEMAWLSGGGKLEDFEDEGSNGQDGDEDLMNDPLMQMNMPSYIVNTVRNSYTQNVNDLQNLVGGLTLVEKAVMGRRVLTIG